MKLLTLVSSLALMGMASHALAQEQQRVVITGSSIKRIADEAALPMQVISRVELERQGIVNAEQMIATLSINANGLDNLASNADVVAGKLATVLKAEKLVLLTNTPGVLDKEGKLLTDLTARQIDAMFEDGTLSGGMLPKIASALDAARAGVRAVHIIDGRVPHALLLEVLSDQAYGTMIRSH